MKVKLFHNFTTEPFAWTWNSKMYRFKPGEKRYLPSYLAEHFAKHLANRELKNDDASKSPSKPEQVPAFYELFQKACIDENPEDQDDRDQAQIDAEMAQRTHGKGLSSDMGNSNDIENQESQVLTVPDDDGDSESFKDE